MSCHAGSDSTHTECISGTIHAGLPQGKEAPLHGLNTYTIGNTASPRAILVVYTDIFGLNLPNNKLIADAYAKSGEYLVHMPDFFEGDAAKLNLADLLIPVDAANQSTLGKYGGLLMSIPSFLLWMGRHGKDKTEKVCMDWLAALRREHPDKKIGIVGMCWGGRYAIRAAKEDHSIELVDGKKVPLVDAAVALHPSNLVMPTDAEGLFVPVSCGWGEEDTMTNIKLKGEIEQLVKKERDAGKEVPEIEHRVYKPGRHGFAVRGNPEDPAEKKCLEDSVTQVLEWSNRWL